MKQVQFNLLPPSKMKVIEAESQHNQLAKKAFRVALVCLALFIVSLVYNYGIQRTQIKSAGNGIQDKTTQLQQTADLNTILTVQNQLQTASDLHQRQHDSSRLFDYFAKLTPLNASLGSINLDLTANTIKIEGTADSATTVNAFIDALKYSQYTIGNAKPAKAFSAIVENTFSINQNSVSFSLSANFDPRLFTNQAQAPVLSVPNSTTVHSNNPSTLFGGGQ